MLFNSLAFAIFLPVAFLLYWQAFSGTVSRQNAFLLLVSWLFYAFWDWRCLFLLIAVSLWSWCIGINIARCRAKGQTGKALCALNIVLSVVILFVFKYYHFFADSFLSRFGIGCSDKLFLDLVLPVGLSFYLFKSMSYTIDVYRGKIKPEHNVVNCCLYIGFFPHLLAGPIERASNMFPQLRDKREFSYRLCSDACRQFLWGLFKKVIIAGNCAIYVDKVFGDYSLYAASTLVLAATIYAVQIYADFSGYSDMAIAVGKLFGIETKKNFDMPYFSRNISEFWRKWHISLTSWFTEYIYIPLGGSKVKKINVLRNTLVVFLLSGLWHGANWNYLVWGAYHAFLFIPFIVFGRKKKYDRSIACEKSIPSFKEIVQMTSVFLLTLPGWIMFRSDGLDAMTGYFSALCNKSILSIPYILNRPYIILLFIYVLIMLAVEWTQRTSYATMPQFKNRFLRYFSYVAMMTLILLYSMQDMETNSNFIYMAF